MSRKKAVIGVIAAVVVVLGVVSLLKFGSFIFIVPVFLYFSNWLHNELRIDAWLARAVVAFMVLPFLFTIKASVSNKEAVRKKGLIGLSILTGMCFLGLFFYSSTSQFFDPQTGGPVKWYAETSEGIRFFDKQGFDPKYGKELKPVTGEVVEKARKTNHLGIDLGFEKVVIPIPIPSFGRNAEGAQTSTRLPPVENYEGWVTVMDTELSPTEWTEWFVSTKYKSWKLFNEGEVEAEIKGGPILLITDKYQDLSNKTLRFRGNNHVVLRALPW